MIVARVSAAPPSGPGIMPTLLPVFLSSDESYLRWRTTNVRPQKQFGFVTATATIPLGDFTSEQMRVLAELSEAYADGSVRITVDQDLVFRWVAVGDLHDLYRRLGAASLGLAEASTVADVTSCPGRRIVPPGGHAVARPRAPARGAAARAARPDCQGGRRAHQDQRLPERLRPAPHRHDRIPGQRAAGGRQAGAAVLRDGRRRQRPSAARASREPPPRFRPGGSPKRSSA